MERSLCEWGGRLGGRLGRFGRFGRFERFGRFGRFGKLRRGDVGKISKEVRVDGNLTYPG